MILFRLQSAVRQICQDYFESHDFFELARNGDMPHSIPMTRIILNLANADRVLHNATGMLVPG